MVKNDAQNSLGGLYPSVYCGVGVLPFMPSTVSGPVGISAAAAVAAACGCFAHGLPVRVNNGVSVAEFFFG